MNKKWSAKNVRSVLAWLEKRWPDLFAPGPDRKPLAVGIHKQILAYRSELPELSRRTLDEALKRHMTSHGYLYGMARHSHRYDLTGTAVAPVEAVHREWAAQLLRKKQKESQRARKNRRKPVVNGNRGKKPAFLDSRPAGKSRAPARPAMAAAPVVRYKQRRRRTIAPVAEVEMAG